MNGQHDDIDRYQRDYEPRQGYKPGPEVLGEGSFDFEILRAELAVVGQDRPQSIFRLDLRVTSGARAGVEIERPTFFTNHHKLNYLGGEFLTLGVDAAQWGKRGKPWSQELREAAPQLVGRRFVGVVESYDKQDGTKGYDLRVRARIAGGAMPAAQTAPPWRPPAQAAGQPVGAAAGGDDDSIPF